MTPPRLTQLINLNRRKKSPTVITTRFWRRLSTGQIQTTEGQERTKENSSKNQRRSAGLKKARLIDSRWLTIEITKRIGTKGTETKRDHKNGRGTRSDKWTILRMNNRKTIHKKGRMREENMLKIKTSMKDKETEAHMKEETIQMKGLNAIDVSQETVSKNQHVLFQMRDIRGPWETITICTTMQILTGRISKRRRGVCPEKGSGGKNFKNPPARTTAQK